jgi:hypothetical protein
MNQFQDVEQMVSSINLLCEYEALTEKAQNKDRDLINHLREQGYCTARGIDWRSCIIKYLTKCLNIRTDKLKDTCQTAKGIKELTQHFGPGIFVLLLAKAMNE